MTMARQGVPARVVVALDKFKGSLRSDQAVDAVADGILHSAPTASVVRTPIADGGDGTVDAVVRSGFARRAVAVTGAMGQPTTALLAHHGKQAVVEVASASGPLPRSSADRDPLGAHTLGVGEAVRAALDLGVEEIVLGLGGSLSTDGGTGMMRALGGRFLDTRGEQIPLGGAGLLRLDRVDLSGLDPRIRTTRFVLAADVDNPLLGPSGCARIFAPQKGADEAAVEVLEAGLRRLAAVTAVDAGARVEQAAGAGAAGGVGFAGLAYLGARMASGARIVLDIVGLRSTLAGADLLITGEGRLDAQSLHGKAPVAAAALARELDIPVVAVVGTSSLDPTQATGAGFAAVYELTGIEPNPERCMTDAQRLLSDVGQTLVADGWVRARHP
ncbi:MAG: glycerate kinase [Actinobacteria bacterium]|nr:glycerate kinase [Actinomycetota bacterium]